MSDNNNGNGNGSNGNDSVATKKNRNMRQTVRQLLEEYQIGYNLEHTEILLENNDGNECVPLATINHNTEEITFNLTPMLEKWNERAIQVAEAICNALATSGGYPTYNTLTMSLDDTKMFGDEWLPLSKVSALMKKVNMPGSSPATLKQNLDELFGIDGDYGVDDFNVPLHPIQRINDKSIRVHVDAVKECIARWQKNRIAELATQLIGNVGNNPTLQALLATLTQ